MKAILIALADILAAKGKLVLVFLAAFWLLMVINLASQGAGLFRLAFVALVGGLMLLLAWGLIAFWRRVFDLVDTDDR